MADHLPARGPGRKRMKKARRSWEPANLLALSPETWAKFVEKGLTPRWVRKADGGPDRRIDQGFVYACDVLGAGAEPVHDERNATRLGAVPERTDLVLMAIPTEQADAYQNYIAEQADRIEDSLLRTVKENAPTDVGPAAASVEGRITIHDGTKIIE